MPGDIRGRLATAEQSLRGVLHEGLSGCSVPDLDWLLVELSETTLRVSEIAYLMDMALGTRAELDRLRLDAHGAAKYSSPDAAIGIARLGIRDAADAARRSATALHDARQITATIGFEFDCDDDDKEVEF